MNGMHDPEQFADVLTRCEGCSCFDKLSTNGFPLVCWLIPFTLSLSKGERAWERQVQSALALGVNNVYPLGDFYAIRT